MQLVKSLQVLNAKKLKETEDDEHRTKSRIRTWKYSGAK